MPAIVSVEVRDAPGFGSTMNCTVPLPVPLVPAVIRAHGSGAEALHVHALPADTDTLPVPPAAGIVTVVALSEYEQPAFW